MEPANEPANESISYLSETNDEIFGDLFDDHSDDVDDHDETPADNNNHIDSHVDSKVGRVDAWGGMHIPGRDLTKAVKFTPKQLNEINAMLLRMFNGAKVRPPPDLVRHLQSYDLPKETQIIIDKWADGKNLPITHYDSPSITKVPFNPLLCDGQMGYQHSTEYKNYLRWSVEVAHQ